MTIPPDGPPQIPPPWHVPAQPLPPFAAQPNSAAQPDGGGSSALGVVSVVCGGVAGLCGLLLLILSTQVFGDFVGSNPVWILFLLGTISGLVAIGTGIAAITMRRGRSLGIVGTWVAAGASVLPFIAFFLTLVVTIRGSRL